MSHAQMRIGELLVKAGVLSEYALSERLLYAKQVGLPLGQILVQQGDMQKDELLAALQIQALYLEELLDEPTMTRACHAVCIEKMPLESSLSDAGFHDTEALASRLGDLLLDAELISEAELSWALMTCGELAIPLGHALVQTGVLKPSVVAMALGCQKQIRQKTMTPEAVSTKLKEAQAAAAQEKT